MKFKSLEQLQYWQGQALRSRDFNDDLDYAEQLRWRHNRASHGAFGIGFGLTVDASGIVHCGAAYDCLGRELVVPVNRILKPTATDTLQYLVLTWSPSGAVLTWIPPDLASRTPGVLLARAKVEGTLDSAFHPIRARALSRPRMSSGSTPRGNTPWEKIKNVNKVAIGLQVRIDTSAAGFTQRPLYLVSPVWKVRNERFTPPYVIIDDAKNDGFTVRLLLEGSGGQEKYDVASDIQTLTSPEWISHAVKPFLDNDPVARLLPRVDKAVRIDGSALGNVLTLAGTSSLKIGDSVALVNLPRNPAAERSIRAIQVTNASPFDGKVAIRREAAAAGFTAGDAARIDRVLSTSNLLLPNSPFGNVKKNDHLDIVQTLGIVRTVSGGGLSVTLAAAATLTLKKGDVAVRTSAEVKLEAPVMVDGQSLDQTIVTLTTAIPSLKAGDELGVTMSRPGAGQPGAVSGFVDTITTSESERFRLGDVLGGAKGTMAIVTVIEEDVLLLDSALTIAADGTVSISDYGAKSTITDAPVAAVVNVKNPALFLSGDVVALVKGTKAGAAAIGRVLTAAGALNLDKALPGANAGDVVAAVRFSASSPIITLSPLTVGASSKFRRGDQVTLMDTPGACWEIEAIQANVLRLKNGGPAATGTLCVVSVNTVAKVVALGVSAGGPSITIDGPAIARKGWYAAAIDNRWKDATDHVTLDTALPDGTLPGDSIGFAAFTPKQLRIRFASGVTVPERTQLKIESRDELTVQTPIYAIVEEMSKAGQATLSIEETHNQTSDFNRRPEMLSVLAEFTASLADDFAAYAQQKGLALYWLGCELPSPPPPDCPGISADCDCSCH